MKTTTLAILACPQCGGHLQFAGAETNTVQSGLLVCPSCNQVYQIVDGIPHFIEPQGLSGLNRRFAQMYDWLSWIYRLFSKFAFAYIGMPEELARREITDRLDPCGGRILEVSIGPGVNLPYLMNRPDVGSVSGLDISLGQLRRCQSYAAKRNWDVDLFLGNAERLPFQDASFGGVFHVGGINFFNDKQAAIQEMIRVAQSGARILIADETEQGARAYERFVPGFKRSLGEQRPEVVAPIDLVPPSMHEIRLFDVWKGWLYCIEFRKP